jgi:exopolyphosphatase/pppGpp-phosphohydrolase
VLRPERQAVFLPGLVILERILVRTGAAAIEHAMTSVRDGMAERLIQLLGTHRRQDLHSTLLLHTRGA